MQSPTTPDAATSPTTTRQYGWRFWYTIAIVALTVLTFYREPSMLLFAIPFNFALWFLPTWAIVATVRHFRKK